MEQTRSREVFAILEIARVNLRHNHIWQIATAIGLLFFAPVFFSIRSLSTTEAAAPLEVFVSLIGIVLLTPIFKPEEDDRIKDLVQTKFIASTTVYVIRTMCSIISIFVLISMFVIYMLYHDCMVSLSMAFGTMANAIALGSVGMLFSTISSNTAVGYMAAIMFYVANFTMGNKLGNLYLFSMMKGEYGPKVWLISVGSLIIIASIIINKIKRKI